jgi:hypothetical protein
MAANTAGGNTERGGTNSHHTHEKMPPKNMEAVQRGKNTRQGERISKKTMTKGKEKDDVIKRKRQKED